MDNKQLGVPIEKPVLRSIAEVTELIVNQQKDSKHKETSVQDVLVKKQSIKLVGFNSDGAKQQQGKLGSFPRS